MVNMGKVWLMVGMNIEMMAAENLDLVEEGNEVNRPMQVEIEEKVEKLITSGSSP